MRQRQKGMTSSASRKKSIVHAVPLTGLLGELKQQVQQNDSHGEKKKLQNKIVKKFKCDQDFTETIDRG